MMEDATEVRLRVLESEVQLLRAFGERDADFKSEVRAFIAEQRAHGKERAADAKTAEKRIAAAEDAIGELQRFRAKVLGAVAASGVLGGGLGGGIGMLLNMLLSG